jgi:hypothetical protein
MGMGNFFVHKPAKSVERFWEDYTARYGEQILANGLGRYLGGWAEFGEASASAPLWGLIIATSGGFRFHHFPKNGWIQGLFRGGSGEDDEEEKTAFIPYDSIINVELLIEKSWWQRLFDATPPKLLIRYRSGDGSEARFLVETGIRGQEVAEALGCRCGDVISN